MNHKKNAVLIVVATLVLLSAVTAQERKIKREELPPAVEQTVAAQTQGATIKGFSREVEADKTYYEAEIIVNGHSKDILIDEQGNIAEIEAEVALGSLTPAVQEGLRQAAGPGKIGKVESLTKGNKLVAYEAHVTTGGKHSEVQVGPDGKKLAHPE